MVQNLCGLFVLFLHIEHNSTSMILIARLSFIITLILVNSRTINLTQKRNQIPIMGNQDLTKAPLMLIKAVLAIWYSFSTS